MACGRLDGPRAEVYPVNSGVSVAGIQQIALSMDSGCIAKIPMLDIASNALVWSSESQKLDLARPGGCQKSVLIVS